MRRGKHIDIACLLLLLYYFFSCSKGKRETFTSKGFFFCSILHYYLHQTNSMNSILIKSRAINRRSKWLEHFKWLPYFRWFHMFHLHLLFFEQTHRKDICTLYFLRHNKVYYSKLELSCAMQKDDFENWKEF